MSEHFCGKFLSKKVKFSSEKKLIFGKYGFKTGILSTYSFFLLEICEVGLSEFCPKFAVFVGKLQLFALFTFYVRQQELL